MRATPAPPITLIPDVELEKQFAAMAAEARGKIGVTAILIETGDSASFNAAEHFTMHSVYKLPIAMAVMEQVRLGNLDLDEQIGVTKEDMVRQGMRSPLRDGNPNGGEFTIRELIRLSLIESDGTASDVLMRIAGGAGEIQSYLTQIGVREITVAHTEKEIGLDWETQYKDWATPAGAVELLRFLNHRGKMIKDDRTEVDGEANLVLNFMADSMPGARRLRSLLPSATRVAHKTGTGGTRDGITSATNDIGIIYLPNGKHVAIAVFVSDSPAGEKTREAVIAKMAKAAWDRWAK